MTAPSTTPAPSDLGTGPADPISAATGPRLSRYRMRADRHGLHLHAGEVVLCAPYEPVALNMVVVVRCESDGHSPGALLSTSEVEYLGTTSEPLGPCSWGTPGPRR